MTTVRAEETSAVASPSHVTAERTQSEPNFPQLKEIEELSIPWSTPIDVAQYLNKAFPTEQLLVHGLDAFISRLEAAEARLDTELASVVRAHCHDTDKTKSLTNETEATSMELETSLHALTAAAADAQKQVDEALAPAKSVFAALDNVTRTAEALDALVELDDAVIALEVAATSTALDALAADSSPFDRVRDSLAKLNALPENMTTPLKRLPVLRARATVAQERIRSNVLTAFKRLSDVISLASDHAPEKVDDAVDKLRTACVVANAMGQGVRTEVIGASVRRRRASFRAAFAMDETGFAGVDKRFTWLRRELRSNWARLGGERVHRGWGRVFPEEWNVARTVTDGIVAELRDWTSSTLDAGADRDVAVMVSALSKTKDFEIELDRRFKLPTDASFVGAISESFGPWMGAYVTQEDEHLASVLSELVRDEKWICQEGSVLSSATELFMIIKKSMRTCASLDIRQPLFSLHRVFRKHLASYATVLVRQLPGFRNNALADSSNGMDFTDKLNRACAIINTAGYCSTTIHQLEESMKKTVQEAYAVDIDMSVEAERFSTVSAKGIQSLVLLMEEDTEPELKTMSEQPWSKWSEVGDTSKYVQNLSTRLSSSVKHLAPLLTKHHFRFLLEKLAASFMGRFRSRIYKCQQMNNFAAQQVLLDTSSLKGMLLGLPASVHVPTPATFVKYVNREMAGVEALLKVILAPVHSSVETYVALIPEGSAEDFQKVLEIRGLRRAEAAPLLLEYSRKIGPTQRLKPVQRADYEDALRSFSRQGNLASSGGLEGDLASASTDPSGEAQSATVDSVKNLFGMLGNSLIETGLADRLEQVSSQFESTTDKLKKGAAAGWSLFGK